MACRRCGTKTVELAKEVVIEGGVDFTANMASSSYVDTHNAVNVSIHQSLITMNHIALGWSVLTLIKGISFKVEALSPNETVYKCRALFNDNNVTISDRDIWFNCNLQWLRRVAKRHQKVTIETLLALKMVGEPIPLAVEEPTVINQGAKLWGGLQAYLTISDEGYSVTTFQSYLSMLKEVLADEKIGCPECAEHFEQAQDNTAVDTLEEARMWLFTLLNKINRLNGRLELAKEEAYRINNWT